MSTSHRQHATVPVATRGAHRALSLRCADPYPAAPDVRPGLFVGHGTGAYSAPNSLARVTVSPDANPDDTPIAHHIRDSRLLILVS
jgi:hypothetical protein